MKKLFAGTFALALLALSTAATSETATQPARFYVAMETTDGRIVLELDNEKAPLTSQNFVQYVKDGHYDGTIFHRVIPGFVAQGGGYDKDFNEKETRDPIVNESTNGLSNLRGTIAMARTNDPDSATAQYYINLVDNLRLDPSDVRAGYTVFGSVIEGMNVIDSIAEIPTGPGGEFEQDVPFRPVIVIKATLTDAPDKEAELDE